MFQKLQLYQGEKSGSGIVDLPGIEDLTSPDHNPRLIFG